MFFQAAEIFNYYLFIFETQDSNHALIGQHRTIVQGPLQLNAIAITVQ